MCSLAEIEMPGECQGNARRIPREHDSAKCVNPDVKAQNGLHDLVVNDSNPWLIHVLRQDSQQASASWSEFLGDSSGHSLDG